MKPGTLEVILLGRKTIGAPRPSSRGRRPGTGLLLWAVGLWLTGFAGPTRGEEDLPDDPHDMATSTATALAETHPADLTTLAGAEILTPQILPPPSHDAEIEERLQWLDAQLERLPTTQPVTQPATQPAEEAYRQYAEALWPVVTLMRQYRQELDTWRRTRADLARLRQPETLARIHGEVAEYNRRREAYQSRSSDEIRYVWLSRVEEVNKELAEMSRELARLEARQTAREQQTTSLARQRAELPAAVKKSLAELKNYCAGLAESDLLARLQQADSPEAREILLAPKRRLEWEHNLYLLRSAMLPDLQTQVDLAQPLDAERIEALRSYIRVLQSYRQALESARTQSEVEYVRQQLGVADQPEYMKTFWQLRLIMAEAMVDLQRIDAETTALFTQEEFDQLEQRVKRGQWYLDTYTTSLERRPAGSILELYRRSLEFLHRYQGQLTDLEQKLDLVNDRLRAAQERRDMALDQIRIGREKLEQQIRALEGDALALARERQAKLIADVNNQLRGNVDMMITRLETIRERLARAVPMVREHVNRITRERVRLYRRYLLARGPTLPETFDIQGLRNEWRSLRTGVGSPGEHVWAEVARWYQQVKTMPPSRWVTLGSLIILAAAGGGWLSRRAGLAGRAAAETFPAAEAAAAAPLEEGVQPTVSIAPLPGPQPPNLLARLRIQFLLLIGRTAAPVLPLLILALTVVMLEVGGVYAQPTAVGLTFVGLFWLGHAVIRATFGLRYLHLSLVLCRDERTASYHRRWLRLLWTLLAISSAARLLTHESSVTLRTAETVWNLGISALLLLTAVYLMRRKMFLPRGAENRGQFNLRHILLRKLLPLVPVFLLSALLARLAGYAGLVDYIFVGLLLSAAILALSRLILGLMTAPTSPDATAQAPAVELHPLLPALVHTARLVVHILTWLAILAVWGITPLEVNDILQYGLFTTAKGTVTTWRIIAAIFTVVIAVIGSRTLRHFLAQEVFPGNQHIDRGTQAAILLLLHYAILALGVYVAMGIVFLDLGALTILLGTLGLGLGLGLQPLFVNFISGLMILFERQIKIGDLVEINERPGEVTAINMRSTTIRTPDNIEVVIPNAEFVTGRVVNWTLSDRKMRARVDVGVDYGSDPELVRKILLDIANQHPNTLVDPPPQVWLNSFGESSIDFSLVCWFANPESRWQFLTTVRFEILKRFREHNIVIPFPHRTLNVSPDRPIPIEVRMSAQPPADPPARAGGPEG